MMQGFLFRLGRNLSQRPLETTGTAAGLVLAGFLLGGLIDGLFRTGPVIFLASFPITFWAASRVKRLAWFYGNEARSSKRDDLSDQKAKAQAALVTETEEPITSTASEREKESLVGAIEPRTSPVGTSLVSMTEEKAVVRVQSVIHFWCWFAPLTLSVLAFLLMPLGALIGFKVYENSLPWYEFEAEPAIYASIWGSVVMFGLLITAAIWSYFANRPKVEVTITPNTIRYGDALFDRTFAGGLLVGYKSKTAELKANITDDRFGVSRLRLAYGAWGEDLKYMVNSYHANEIVIWLNEIISSVGAPPKRVHDPAAGRKIELL
ncbi:hypothetical protein [Roseovarius sp. MMSF_3350]|uniref:hypothetical protein n=1 Tax=Roseovarius sp. MMSF_3350 TaxID=3046706 RepID=UPI00273E22BA|nr:hypothetical protein [Roseovarius sp. MMSF_3350]